MPAKSQVNFEKQFLNYLIVNSFKGARQANSNDARATFERFDKQVSQVIAKSWLPGGEQIKNALLGGDSDNIKTVFCQEGVDIDNFFAPFAVDVHVDWDTFFGGLSDLKTREQSMQLNIPYPPRPMEVTDSQLEEWVANDDQNSVFPPYPFIPLSCC